MKSFSDLEACILKPATIAAYVIIKCEFQNILNLVLFLFQFVDLGVVTSIESNHKAVESARKGQEVCIKIEPIPGEAPKMFGRHFDEKDFLVSKVRCYMAAVLNRVQENVTSCI